MANRLYPEVDLFGFIVRNPGGRRSLFRSTSLEEAQKFADWHNARRKHEWEKIDYRLSECKHCKTRRLYTGSVVKREISYITPEGDVIPQYAPSCWEIEKRNELQKEVI